MSGPALLVYAFLLAPISTKPLPLANVWPKGSNHRLPSITPFGYHSLKLGMPKINTLLTGRSGVYLLMNNRNPIRFYIGSSVNLARRFLEYYNLTLGLRTPKSQIEQEVAATTANDWTVIVLDFAIPTEIRVLEQLAIYNFGPTMNRSYTVMPLVDQKWGDLSSAMILAGQCIKLFSVGSAPYLQFALMLNHFSLALSTGMSMNPADNAMIGKPVWLYSSVGSTPFIFSSINYAITTLGMSYGTLMTCVNFSYLFALSSGNSNVILSLKPLTLAEQTRYTVANSWDSQVSLFIDIYNSRGVFVANFESRRSLAIWWKRNVGGADRKKLRPYLQTNGTFMGYSFSVVAIPRGHQVYRFDAVTLAKLPSLPSIRVAFKLVNMHYYTFQHHVDNQTPIEGVIYSRKPTITKGK